MEFDRDSRIVAMTCGKTTQYVPREMRSQERSDGAARYNLQYANDFRESNPVGLNDMRTERMQVNRQGFNTSANKSMMMNAVRSGMGNEWST